ncbi:mariner Mos1 transposase [Trichonephila clavipes]|nr:mariner Mos1 transposase [Trichonephila clavipes]
MTESSGRSQKWKNEQLHELLDDDPTQTQQQLARALNMAQETISRRLQATGKINKLDKWVPHNLNERQMGNRKVSYEMLLQCHEKKIILYRIVTGDENWIYFENLKWKNHGFHLAKPGLQHQGQIASARRPYFVSGGTRAALCIMNP